QSDLYIEKEATINDDLDRLRYAAAQSLIERRDVIVVASVSCIYGMDAPESFLAEGCHVRNGDLLERDRFLRQLIKLQYERNDIDFQRGRFRVRGDCVEVYPSHGQYAVRVEFNDERVERISEMDPLLSKATRVLHSFLFYPAKHFVVSEATMRRSLAGIEEELKQRLLALRQEGKLLEAYRLEQRTNYDMEMLREFGSCPGIENYSMYLAGRKPGDRPNCLLNYFPQDFLAFIDESHISIPQLAAMYKGDRSRKQTLIDFGFRLPSALENRPLKFEEALEVLGQTVMVSATPGPFEMEHSSQVVEQLIRPTGLIDPEIEVRPVEGEVEDLVEEIRLRAERNERVLVTTLTKKMSEELAEYLTELGLKVQYLHSEIDTINRVLLLRDLRLGKFDCLVGVNLLREGLDLPEVTLVAILDADREGFLRSERSLIQTIGRTARNIRGKVIMYADVITESMRKAISETDRRRAAQHRYNQEHGIQPETIRKAIKNMLELPGGDYLSEEGQEADLAQSMKGLSASQQTQALMQLEEEMRAAAETLEFERAAQIRDRVFELRKRLRIH
ncbi:MAG: excinuclease ABC subunit UvrB, partial [bacterium]